ncbi:MAG: hypothetical protein H6668_24385 [Ardenticatenaceae bacterium]|nr:hypothetical protein [Ardenticatenaceae bacterium]
MGETTGGGVSSVASVSLPLPVVVNNDQQWIAVGDAQGELSAGRPGVMASIGKVLVTCASRANSPP